MSSPKRDILVVVKNQFISDESIEQQVEYLNEMLRHAESKEAFCIAHELVDRNKISRKHKRILKESSFYRLRAFRFLINKN